MNNANKSFLFDAVEGLDDDLVVGAAEMSPKRSGVKTVLPIVLTTVVLITAIACLPLLKRSKTDNPETKNAETTVQPGPLQPPLVWMHSADDPDARATLSFLSFSEVTNEERCQNTLDWFSGNYSGPIYYSWHGIVVTADLYELLEADSAHDGKYAISVFTMRDANLPNVGNYVFEGKTICEMNAELDQLRQEIVFWDYVLGILDGEYTREETAVKLAGNLTEDELASLKPFLKTDPVDEVDYDLARMTEYHKSLIEQKNALDDTLKRAHEAYEKEYPPVKQLFDFDIFKSFSIWSERNVCPIDCYVSSLSLACFAISYDELLAIAEKMSGEFPDMAENYYFTLACRSDFVTE